jgi:tetratricopeptide (TPR) repeat protein
VLSYPVRTLLRELVAIRRSAGSSAFDVEGEGVTTTLIVREGVVVSVESTQPGEVLGRILLRKRVVTAPQYLEVLDKLLQAVASGPKRTIRFDELAVELGLVTRDQVRRALADELKLQAARVFFASSPTWTKRSVAPWRTYLPVTSFKVESLFLEAMRWIDGALRRALGIDEALERALQPVWDLPEIDRQFQLTPEEKAYVREALAGGRTVAELLAAPREGIDAEALLTALFATGAAEPCPRRDVERSLPPPVDMRSSIPGIELDDASIDAMLGNLGDSATPPVSQPSPDSAALENALRAERAFQRAREKMRRGSVRDALPDLDEAVSIRPRTIEYGVYAAWARHAASDAELSQPKAAELEKLARDAIRAQPQLAFAHFVLGEALHAAGQGDKARKERMLALKMDPELFEALRAERLRDVARAPSSRRPVMRRVSDPGDAPPPPLLAPAPPALAPPALAPTALAPPAPAPPTPAPEPAIVEPSEPSPAADALPVSEERARPEAIEERAADPVAPPPERSAVSLIGYALMALAAGGTAAALVGRCSPPPRFSVVMVPAPSSTAAPSAETVAAAPSLPSAAPVSASERSLVLLPAYASQHRVYLDGRQVGSGATELWLPCGHHLLRIGSHGTDREIELPCGGKVDLR